MTQIEAILKHLENGRSINPLEALNLYGCFRLGARIWDLKHRGYNIACDIVNAEGKHWAKYTLITKREPSGQMIYAFKQ